MWDNDWMAGANMVERTTALASSPGLSSFCKNGGWLISSALLLNSRYDINSYAQLNNSKSFKQAKTKTNTILIILNLFQGMGFLLFNFARRILDSSIEMVIKNAQAGIQTRIVSLKQGLNWGRSVFQAVLRSRRFESHTSILEVSNSLLDNLSILIMSWEATSRMSLDDC